jgi:WD40 repeat protein
MRPRKVCWRSASRPWPRDKARMSSDAEVRNRAADITKVIGNKLFGPDLRVTDHSGGVWSVVVSADGKRLLTSRDDRTLRLWDTGTGKELHVFEGHSERMSARPVCGNRWHARTAGFQRCRFHARASGATVSRAIGMANRTA